MDNTPVLLLDPTPRALIGLDTPVRHSAYHRIVDLANECVVPSAKRSRDRVQISMLDNMLQIAFARLQDGLVILSIGDAASIVKQELEAQVATLAHMGFAGLGLQILDLPRKSSAGIKLLDNATNLYTRSMLRALRADFGKHVFFVNHHGSYDHADLLDRFTNNYAKVWGSSDARQNFKVVLDHAERDPQVIERGNRRFLLVEESRLPAIMGRKNAQEMYQHFFEDTEPVEPFERIRSQPPGRLLNLG